MIVRQFTCRGVINSHLYAHLKRPQVSLDMARPSSGSLYLFFFLFSLIKLLLLLHPLPEEQLLYGHSQIHKLPLLSFCVMCLCSDLAAFREIFSQAKSIAIITGAGVSAESGVPTFRGAGGYWRKWQAQVCNRIIMLLNCLVLL